MSTTLGSTETVINVRIIIQIMRNRILIFGPTLKSTHILTQNFVLYLWQTFSTIFAHILCEKHFDRKEFENNVSELRDV